MTRAIGGIAARQAGADGRRRKQVCAKCGYCKEIGSSTSHVFNLPYAACPSQPIYMTTDISRSSCFSLAWILHKSGREFQIDFMSVMCGIGWFLCVMAAIGIGAVIVWIFRR